MSAIWHRVKTRLRRATVFEAGRRLLPAGTVSIFGLHAASLVLLMLGSIPVYSIHPRNAMTTTAANGITWPCCNR